MKIIHQVHPEDFSRYNTSQIRGKFLLENLVTPDKIECAYTHYDRMIIGAAMPVNTKLELGTYEPLKSEFFLSRREIGIINIAGNGSITVDNNKYDLEKQDCPLYRAKAIKRSYSAAPVNQTRPNSFSSPALLTRNILQG